MLARWSTAPLPFPYPESLFAVANAGACCRAKVGGSGIPIHPNKKECFWTSPGMTRIWSSGGYEAHYRGYRVCYWSSEKERMLPGHPPAFPCRIWLYRKASLNILEIFSKKGVASLPFYFLIFASTIDRIFDAERLRAFASWKIVINEGCLWPHSRSEMKLGSRLLTSASFSWEIWFAFLSSLMASPNASSIVKFTSDGRKLNRSKRDILLTTDNNAVI